MSPQSHCGDEEDGPLEHVHIYIYIYIYGIHEEKEKRKTRLITSKTVFDLLHMFIDIITYIR